jgi:Putative transposase/Transposase zinc-binding domain
LRPAYELAQVIDRFGSTYVEQQGPNAYVQRILRAIERCRTAELGGHKDRCDECGHIRISYNSCRNRHCPKCQNTRRESWLESRKQDLLPVPYFHVVFTVPERLNGLFLYDPSGMYKMLFGAVWETIAQFSWTKLHGETGMIAVLHTWGQNLSLHPHLHCIVPGGGLDVRGHWKPLPLSKAGKAYLFPVENLSRVFRGKFLSALQQQVLPQERTFVRELYKTNWVVYAKEPFAGPDQVIEYLGRYTHKTAISNHRLVSIDETGVQFRYRDYRDNKQKQMRLSGTEFLRRFCQHILPKGFVRIRHYGLLASKNRPRLQQLQRYHGIHVTQVREHKDWKQLCREHLGYDPDLCPHCKKGKMVTIERFDPVRGPPEFLKVSQTAWKKSQ